MSAGQQAYSIAEFCKVHGISRGMYYILENEGRAPITMHLGRRRLISREEAAHWREQMIRIAATTSARAQKGA